jgi:hypothetical protein
MVEQNILELGHRAAFFLAREEDEWDIKGRCRDAINLAAQKKGLLTFGV